MRGITRYGHLALKHRKADRMKNTKAARRSVFLIMVLIALVAFAGCSKATTTDLIDDGADRFAEGKEEQDYSLKTSAAQLSELIDNYSGGLSIPSGTQLPPDQMPEDPSSQEGDTPGGTPSITIVHNDDEYIRVLHSAMNNLDADLKIKTDPSYSIDPYQLGDFLIKIERNDPIAVSVSNISYSFITQGNTVYYKFDYGINTKKLEQMRQDTKNAVKQIAGSMDVSGKTDYEIVCMVNDYLCDNVVYPDSEPYTDESHTPHAALVDGNAVCEGYAGGAKLLLNELGVECDMEFGDCIGGGGHAWNLVKVDGKWYQLDVTWNDACGDRTEYLLTTDSFMSNSRTWDTSLYPACTDTTYHK